MADLPYRVGILGCMARPHVPWNRQNLQRLLDLGFNTMQLNIAWGPRPGDEPLNLEDVIALPAALAEELAQPLAPRSDPSPERRAERQRDLHQRLALCQEMGVRTIFHFGAPFNGATGYLDQRLPNCLLDGVTPRRYVALLEAFATEYPGVDDILVYTFDQDAWLCNEFGACERCRGIPLHERVVPFLHQLAATWRRLSPKGRLWWEPWELSAGQVLRCTELLDGSLVGLAVHSNIAEVMAALPVDRWLKNVGKLARARSIPLIVEGWLGGASEELEPYTCLQHPVVTLRALKAMAGVEGAVGIKEYYGLLPDREDPNLRMTGLFFADPAIGEEEALQRLAEPYGPAAPEALRFWRLCADAMELFPWDTSWFIREVGRCDPAHSMAAAFIRGQQCHTPSWDSTRRAVFMKTDNAPPDPWLLEDVQLRCELAAGRMAEALQVGQEMAGVIRPDWRPTMRTGLEELDGFRRRALSYVYHLRETNLATVMRRFLHEGQPIPGRTLGELRATLLADQANQGAEEPVGAALRALDEDAQRFLQRYFLPEEDRRSKGYFSVTST